MAENETQWQAQLDDAMKKILNREKFSYDLNGDALYQQLRDKYIQQGKMAMKDTIGRASAMTGGYGNSYAQSIGQQAYDAQLQDLNDIVPELYQLALDKYNTEGQDAYNRYAMLSERTQTESEQPNIFATPTTPEIPTDIINAVKGAKTNQQKADILAGYVNDGVIDSDQAAQLLADHGNVTKDLKDRTWTQVYDGGINWWGGVDNDAEVKDQYGKTYRLDDLVDELVKEGMTKKEATEFVEKFYD